MASLYTPLLAALLLLVASAASYFFVQLYNARRLFKQCKKLGLPVAPNHSFFFGHLLYLKTRLDALPPQAHWTYALGDIGRDHFAEEGCFYIDAWPVTSLILVVFSPQIAAQVQQSNAPIAMTRPTLLPKFFKPIAGGRNLFDLGEREWRPWRAVFVKGFNAAHISALIPGMVKETQAYCKALQKRVGTGEIFSLDELTLRFTMDLTGETVLLVSSSLFR